MTHPAAMLPALAGRTAIVLAVAWLAIGVRGAAAADKDAKPGAKAAAKALPPAPSETTGGPSSPRRKYTTETLRGRVVWLEEALARGFGVTTEPSAAETSVVLETADGKLWPLVPDTRGRAFAVDERLRDIDLQLLVRRYTDAPLVQVIRVFRATDDGLHEVDYWCDICAIPMYILKPCECCQGSTRLRETPVEGVPKGG
jgi:hypothetical protein